MKYSDLKQEIKSEFSETKEKDDVFIPVEFDAIFSHDRVIKKQCEKNLLASDLHQKPKSKKSFDNRFMSKRMREIMFLPVVK